MILCSGEALIDMLPCQTTEGGTAFAPFPGGAVFNTAIALGRLGVEIGFFSGLSNDLFGKALTDALTQAGVDYSLASRADRPTTLAFVTLTNGQAQYAFYDENTAGRMLDTGDLPTLPNQVKALFFGGISLVSEPCGSAYEALMLKATKTHVTMIDPNIRPSFITDETAYRSRLARLLSVADIVKLSDEDLDWLGIGADDILQGGAALVLITKGASGVQVRSAAGGDHVPAQSVEIIDTIGAGDTFNAGVLAGLERGGLMDKSKLRGATLEGIRPAVELGVRAAAITVSRAGANPPWQEELA